MALRAQVVSQRISSDAASMAALHGAVGWTPRDIRPTPIIRAARCDFLDEVDRIWASPGDSVLCEVFKVRPEPGSAERLVADPEGVKGLHSLDRALVPARFPYDCPPGTGHACLWYFLGIADCRLDPPGEDAINAALVEEFARWTDASPLGAVASGTAPSSLVEAVWYPNPKPSVEDRRLFHVQVVHAAPRSHPCGRPAYSLLVPPVPAGVLAEGPSWKLNAAFASQREWHLTCIGLQRRFSRISD